MNLKLENGITIIALIITIILMLILAGVGMHFGSGALDKAKLEDIKTDMISIKTKAKIITEQYNFKDREDLVGSKASDEEIQKLGLTEKEKNQIRKLSSEDLSNQGLSSIEGDVYVVYYDKSNPNNCEVYYLNGYQGKYSLSELQDI